MKRFNLVRCGVVILVVLGGSLALRADVTISGGVTVSGPTTIKAGPNAAAESATNIVNAQIAAGAGIDATKLADGSVSNTELQKLGNVTGTLLQKEQIDTEGEFESLLFTLPEGGGGGSSMFVNDAEVANPNLKNGTNLIWSVTETNVFGFPTNITSSQVADGTLTADDLAPDSVSASELNGAGVASELEAAMALQNIGGAVTSSQLPAVITGGVVTLTDAATIATDASLGNLFRVTLGGNRTLGEPTNPTDGQRVTWEFAQDATGSRTISFDAVFGFGSDLTSITLSTTANKRDFMTAVYNSSAGKWFIVGFLRGY